jgi:hypothetical protein
MNQSVTSTVAKFMEMVLVPSKMVAELMKKRDFDLVL